MTGVMVIFNGERVGMIVRDAANPDDPAFNPPGGVRVDIPQQAYAACGHADDLREACVPYAKVQHPLFGEVLEAAVAAERQQREAARIATAAPSDETPAP